MILQALADYYYRKAADPESGIAPEGWEWKEIPFLMVIDKDGHFLAIEDTRETEGKKKRAKTFLVLQGEKRHPVSNPICCGTTSSMHWVQTPAAGMMQTKSTGHLSAESKVI